MDKNRINVTAKDIVLIATTAAVVTMTTIAAVDFAKDVKVEVQKWYVKRDHQKWHRIHNPKVQ
jgi:hypothetical protein